MSGFGGGGASQNGVVNDQGSTSAIAGLWDFTQGYGAEGTDVFYIYCSGLTARARFMTGWVIRTIWVKTTT